MRRCWVCIETDSVSKLGFCMGFCFVHSGSQCLADLNLTNNDDTPPYLCSSPIKVSNHSGRMNESLQDPAWEFSLDLQELWQLTDLVWVVGGRWSCSSNMQTIHQQIMFQLEKDLSHFGWSTSATTLPLDSSLVIWQMYATFLPYSCPPKKHTKLSYKPFLQNHKMHNSSNIIAADGLSVMNFFGGDGMGCEQPVLEAVSNTISFKNPNAPVWPRLALGKEWDTVSSQHHVSLCLSQMLWLLKILKHVFQLPRILRSIHGFCENIATIWFYFSLRYLLTLNSNMYLIIYRWQLHGQAGIAKVLLSQLCYGNLRMIPHGQQLPLSPWLSQKQICAVHIPHHPLIIYILQELTSIFLFSYIFWVLF